MSNHLPHPGRAPSLHIASDNGSGPAVLLVHGIASSATTFDPVLPLLGGHRAIAVDLLGFGRSPAPLNSDYTIDDHVAFLERTIEDVRVEGPIVVVGHSMGSLIVARLAARNPSLVHGVVLVSPPVYLPPEILSNRTDRATMGLYLRIYEFLGNNRDFSVSAAQAIAQFLPREGLLHLDEHDWRPFALSLRHCIESQTTIDDISNITAPIEVIYGALDPLMLREGLHIVSRMRNVHTEKISGADHIVRERLARAIADAVNRVSSPVGP
ncbi:MAG: alpha/beta hydrolase [Actinomycetota bacterium]